MRTSISTTSGSQANHGGGDAGPVSTFADDVEAVPLAQDATQTGPDEFLVVDDEDADHFAAPCVRAGASAACTSQPLPPGPASHCPPRASARSRMPSSPRPVPAVGGPELSTVTCTAESVTATYTVQAACGACFAALVRLSCTIR